MRTRKYVTTETHMNIQALAASNNPIFQLRAEVLSESEFTSWFNARLDGLGSKSEESRTTLLLDLSEHDFLQYIVDPTTSARVGLHIKDCIDEDYVFVTEVLGMPSTASEHDNTKYLEWNLIVAEWPFITTHIVEDALRSYRAGLSDFPVDLVDTCLRRHYPSSNNAQLREWYMADLLDLNAGDTGAALLPDVLRQQTWLTTAQVLQLPQDL